LATDADGHFLFPNVPPEREFVLFAKMDSLQGRGVLPSKTFTTGKTGSSLELGTLEVKPAHRLAGRVILSDRSPIPPTLGSSWRGKGPPTPPRQHWMTMAGSNSRPFPPKR